MKEIEQQKKLSYVHPETTILLKAMIAIFCMSARNRKIILVQPKEEFLNRKNYLKVLKYGTDVVTWDQTFLWMAASDNLYLYNNLLLNSYFMYVCVCLLFSFV